jgi:hypothetical protein
LPDPLKIKHNEIDYENSSSEKAKPIVTSQPADTIIALVNDESLRQGVKAFADSINASVIWQLELPGLIGQMSQLRPRLVLVDLAEPPDTWQPLVHALKTNPATRRLSILGFAIGLSPIQRQLAQAAFLDDIFEARDDSKGAVLSSLASRAAGFLRQHDAEIQHALQTPCQNPMPALVWQGVQAFNAGQYYEAHEDLETAWVEENSLVRNLYQGILQVGVAYFQIQRGNYWGAVKMFLRAFQWLSAMPEVCHGIDIAQLRQDAWHVWQALESLGPERVHEFDQTLFKPIHLKSA